MRRSVVKRWGPMPRRPNFWFDVVRDEWLVSLRRHRIHPTTMRMAVKYLDQTQPGTSSSQITTDEAWTRILLADKLMRQATNTQPVRAQ